MLLFLKRVERIWFRNLKTLVFCSETWQREEINCFDVSNGRRYCHSIKGQASSGVEMCSAHDIDWCLDILASTVHKIICSILHCYPYKITHVHELIPADLQKREAFALEFFTHMEEDNEWLWDILRIDEAHFHLHRFINTQNRKIWAKEKSFSIASVPMHSPKVTGRCAFTIFCVIGSFLFEEIGPVSPVTCTMNDKRYVSLLHSQVVPTLQQHAYLERTIFMQDGASQHIAKPVMQLLKKHFRNNWLISHHCLTVWTLRSQDLNPCDFWLWG